MAKRRKESISDKISEKPRKTNENKKTEYILENIDTQIEDELAYLLNIKPAARTIDQKKRIKHFYYLKNKENSNEKRRIKRQNMNLEKKAELIKKVIDRKNIRNKDMDIEKKTELRDKDKNRKQKQRAHQTPEEKSEASLKNIE